MTTPAALTPALAAWATTSSREAAASFAIAAVSLSVLIALATFSSSNVCGFILSAEIMAITLETVSDESILMQALVLALVGIGITAAVYGVVALIVKADDVGVALAKNDRGSITGGVSRAFGRALVLGMPSFLTFLGAAGTAA